MAELIAVTGNDLAVTDEAGSQTRAELDRRVNRLVHGLRSLGLDAGDRIGVLCGNRREFYEVLLATLHGGWIFVPINTHFTRDEVRYVLEDADARVFVADAQVDRVAAGQLADLGPDDRSFVIGDGGNCSYEELLSRGHDDEPEHQRCGSLMFYTSGTTGSPKGVRTAALPLGAPVGTLAAAARAFCELTSIPDRGVTLLCGPAYHSAQLALTMWPLLNGSRLIMSRRFSASRTLELIVRHRVTNLHLVPTQFVRLLGLPHEERRAFTPDTLVAAFHGAAPCPPEVKRAMIEWWGPVLVEYYGATEAGLVSLVSSAEWSERPGTVGRPLANRDVVVIGEDGRRLGPGETGDLYIRRRDGDFEYHNDPAKTDAAHLEEGLFTVGDVGHVDGDGYVFITDRRIDMIISGGVNIYPAEVEAVLAAHPAVADVAVIGAPNDEFGEEVKAIVQTVENRPDGRTLSDELERWCRATLAGFKVPRSFDYVDSLPRSEAGKLNKRRLRDTYSRSGDR